MTLLVILLVMLAAFTAVGWPLIRSARAAGREPDEASPLNDLISRRDAAYRAIRELDFEYHLGNLSESDYRGLRKRYRSEAAAILRELDTAMAEVAAHESSPSGPATPTTVASTAWAQEDPPCPSCGGSTEARDHYCRSCGARLEAGA